jgi:hypothetical protein
VNVPNEYQKAAISVSEMAGLCRLSRSRFHALVRDGVFPRPVLKEPSKRPYYTAELAQRCLEIRTTGIGQHGEIVLFNRPATKRAARKPAAKAPAPTEHAELVDALRSLGLVATVEAVTAAMRELYPAGAADINQGEVIRKVFLHLRTK